MYHLLDTNKVPHDTCPKSTLQPTETRTRSTDRFVPHPPVLVVKNYPSKFQPNQNILGLPLHYNLKPDNIHIDSKYS